MEGRSRNPHSHKLRQGRFSIPNQVYLVTTVTRERTPVFRDLEAGRLLVRALKSHDPWAETLCYVVMPDHFHWLLRLRTEKPLSSVVGGVKRTSAKAINRLSRRKGPVWQDGFHDRALRAEENIQSVARYVVANPLRAGLVKAIGDYPLWDAMWL